MQVVCRKEYSYVNLIHAKHTRNLNYMLVIRATECYIKFGENWDTAGRTGTVAWENWDINFFLLWHALQLKDRCSSQKKFSKLAEVAWYCACPTKILLRGDTELGIDLEVPQISCSVLG